MCCASLSSSSLFRLTCESRRWKWLDNKHSNGYSCLMIVDLLVRRPGFCEVRHGRSSKEGASPLATQLPVASSAQRLFRNCTSMSALSAGFNAAFECNVLHSCTETITPRTHRHAIHPKASACPCCCRSLYHRLCSCQHHCCATILRSLSCIQLLPTFPGHLESSSQPTTAAERYLLAVEHRQKLFGKDKQERKSHS